MRAILPHIFIARWTGCERGGEAEGHVLVIRWARLRIEIAVGWWQA